MTVDTEAFRRPHRAAPVYDSARRPHPAIEELVELVRYRDLLWLWSLRNLTLRYKRSALGVVWTLLEPLMMMAILSVVFTQIFRFAVANYPVYILSALLLFDFFSRSTNQMIEEIITSQNLARRIYAPRSAFALAAIVSYLVNWLLALVPLLAIMLILGAPLSPALATIPAGIALTALFATGVGLLIASIGAFFHDVKLIYQVLLSAWFYLTPIIYPLEIIPERWRHLFTLNPLYHLCALVRDPVFEARVASPQNWIVAVVASLAVALLGWLVFTRLRDALDYQ